MQTKPGYGKPIFILAFDQRSSFTKKMFGIEGKAKPGEAQTIAGYKYLIYKAFERGLQLGVPKEHAALLVDEEFGDKVLRDARAKGYKFLLPVEKSGQDELDFEYGSQAEEHVEKYQPTFVKVLLRYNPEGDEALNTRQIQKLQQLGDLARRGGYKFLIEALVPATADQLASVGGDVERYDRELRPGLEAEMIRKIQEGGGEPDVWKIEGLEKPEHYQKLVEQARSGGREQVGVIVLGRHAPDEQVERWLTAGASVAGVIGFAIGRTIFWEPLLAVKQGKLRGEQAVAVMAGKYRHFYRIFNEARRA